MTKSPTKTENKKKKQREKTKMQPNCSITQPLQTKLERSVGVTTAT